MLGRDASLLRNKSVAYVSAFAHYVTLWELEHSSNYDALVMLAFLVPYGL